MKRFLFALSLILLMFSTSVFSTTDPYAACQRINSYYYEQECFNVVRGGNFIPYAVYVCDRYTTASSTIECLAIIKNRYFQEDALRVCNRYQYASSTSECLKIIANYSFSSYDLRNCDSYTYVSATNSCLIRARYPYASGNTGGGGFPPASGGSIGGGGFPENGGSTGGGGDECDAFDYNNDCWSDWSGDSWAFSLKNGEESSNKSESDSLKDGAEATENSDADMADMKEGGEVGKTDENDKAGCMVAATGNFYTSFLTALLILSLIIFRNKKS